MSGIKVMSGVPVPSRSPRRNTSKYPFAEMDVGHYFFLPERSTDQFATYASLYGRKLDRKFTTRTCTMRLNAKKEWIECAPEHEKAVTGCGVWRLA